MLAIVSPGQGAQKPGFLAPWMEHLAERGKSIEALSESAGIDVRMHGVESDAETIKDTAIAQPLLVAASLIAAEELMDPSLDGPCADIIAGHSVGEVAAAALAGVISAEDAMRIVAVRSQAMARAAARTPTGMSAVVGGQRNEVMSAIEEAGLSPANINSASQVVAAGSPEGLAVLAENPPARARVIPLSVAGAFHTSYMESAREALHEAISNVTVADPRGEVHLLTNAGGRVVTDGREFLSLLVSQVSAPVNWEACMSQMAHLGITGLLELNPAGTLTGLAKRDLKGVELFALNTPDQLEDARAFVRQHAQSISKEK